MIVLIIHMMIPEHASLVMRNVIYVMALQIQIVKNVNMGIYYKAALVLKLA